MNNLEPYGTSRCDIMKIKLKKNDRFEKENPIHPTKDYFFFRLQ